MHAKIGIRRVPYAVSKTCGPHTEHMVGSNISNANDRMTELFGYMRLRRKTAVA
jgi:hypothetical protein